MNSIIAQGWREKITCSWWTLKLTYGLLFVIAGADKFMNLVTDWPKYVSPYFLKMLPLLLLQLIQLVGVFEIGLGIVILAINTRIGAYIATGWLLVIALNLLSMGMYFDIAVRDVVMAIGAIVLGQLTSVQEELSQRA